MTKDKFDNLTPKEKEDVLKLFIEYQLSFLESYKESSNLDDKNFTSMTNAGMSYVIALFGRNLSKENRALYLTSIVEYIEKIMEQVE